jgi:hypothetical protein
MFNTDFKQLLYVVLLSKKIMLHNLRTISSGIHLQNLLVCINEHRKLKSIYVEWHLIAHDLQFNNPAATQVYCLEMTCTVNNEQE